MYNPVRLTVLVARRRILGTDDEGHTHMLDIVPGVFTDALLDNRVCAHVSSSLKPILHVLFR